MTCGKVTMDKIAELAKEVDACFIPRYDMWQMDSETLQKFAEQIIRECANLAGNAECNDRELRSVYDVILDNFGLK